MVISTVQKSLGMYRLWVWLILVCDFFIFKFLSIIEFVKKKKTWNTITKTSNRIKSLFGLTVPEGWESVMAGKHGSQQQAWLQEQEMETSKQEVGFPPQCPTPTAQPTGNQMPELTGTFLIQIPICSKTSMWSDLMQRWFESQAALTNLTQRWFESQNPGLLLLTVWICGFVPSFLIG